PKPEARSPKNYMADSASVKSFRIYCEKMRFLKFDFLHNRDYNAFLKAVHHSITTRRVVLKKNFCHFHADIALSLPQFMRRGEKAKLLAALLYFPTDNVSKTLQLAVTFT
ncbi:MAG: hypothetical protein IJ727_00435, partial [Treponema sp.]|nr:hypothetical protein [Treponema sp.]